MVSAFLNTVKIPELRRRILFTLAVIVIVRLGAAITTPGVNQAVLQEWFRTASDQRGRAGKLRDLLLGHYALYQCVDHDAVAHRSYSAARQNGARRWRPTEDHAVDALHHSVSLHFPRLPAGTVISASGIVPHDAAGNH
jgi:hypothetical protein